MVATVQKDNLYCSKSLKFDELESYSSNRYAHQRRHDAAALGKEQTASAGSDQTTTELHDAEIRRKYPRSDAYDESVERRFRNNGQLQFFLEDRQCCYDHAAWSTAFASRIVNSVTDSSIFGCRST